MSSTFFSSFNDSTALPFPNSTHDSPLDSLKECLRSTASFFSFGVVMTVLHLPLSICIVLDGLHRWWQGGRSCSSSFSSVSHSDYIAYHMVAMELIAILGWTIMDYDLHRNDDSEVITEAGMHMATFTTYGEMFFLNFLCAERHLAVVYPITYRSLRGARAFRMRNVSMAMVWLFSGGGAFLTRLYPVPTALSLHLLSLFFISYFSVSVLCFLMGPGPGRQSRDSERQRHSQALYSILTTLLTLLFRFFCGTISAFVSVRKSSSCMIWNLELWSSLPSSLLIPILYLQRTWSACAVRKARNKDNQQVHHNVPPRIS